MPLCILLCWWPGMVAFRDIISFDLCVEYFVSDAHKCEILAHITESVFWLALVITFRRLLSLLSGTIWAWLGLPQYLYLLLFGIDNAHGTYHHSSVHSRVLWKSVVCQMRLFSLIAWCAYWLSSWHALWYIFRFACYHPTWYTYPSSLSIPVDSSPAALTTTIHFTWWN